MVILLPYFEDIYCMDFQGETFRILKKGREHEVNRRLGTGDIVEN